MLTTLQSDIADRLVGTQPSSLDLSSSFWMHPRDHFICKLALSCIGRVIAGLGAGFIPKSIILYMSEIASKKVRGALVVGEYRQP